MVLKSLICVVPNKLNEKLPCDRQIYSKLMLRQHFHALALFLFHTMKSFWTTIAQLCLVVVFLRFNNTKL